MGLPAMGNAISNRPHGPERLTHHHAPHGAQPPAWANEADNGSK